MPIAKCKTLHEPLSKSLNRYRVNTCTSIIPENKPRYVMGVVILLKPSIAQSLIISRAIQKT